MGELGPRERERCGMRTRRRAAPYPESPSNSTSTRRSMPLPDLRARPQNCRCGAHAERVPRGRRELRGHGRGARTGCEASREAPRGRRAPCEPSSRRAGGAAILAPSARFSLRANSRKSQLLAVVSQSTVRSRTGPVISHACDIMPRAATSRPGVTSWDSRDLTSGVRSQKPHDIALGHVVKTSDREIKRL